MGGAEEEEEGEAEAVVAQVGEGVGVVGVEVVDEVLLEAEAGVEALLRRRKEWLRHGAKEHAR